MNITYKDIEQANANIKTTPIKGKDYAEVNQRIKAFRMVFPTGAISTEMLSNENEVCVFKATVGFYQDNEFMVLGTGTAYERENATFINKTSYIENCETSAVGRALGMAGFGIDTSVASYEEVGNAIANQQGTLKEDTTEKPINEELAKKIKAWLKEKGEDEKEILKQYGAKKIADIKYSQWQHIMNEINAKVEDDKQQ